MWNRKEKEIQRLKVQLIAKEAYVGDLEPVIIEVRRWISTRTQQYRGRTDAEYNNVMRCVNEIALILSHAPRIGKSRQKSITMRYEGESSRRVVSDGNVS